MLSESAIQLLGIISHLPAKLQHPAFSESNSLWRKEKHHHGFNSQETLSNRYQFVKIGKTLGFQTVRYLSLVGNHLIYYNENTGTDYLGYCDLQNKYIQWGQIKTGRFLLIVSNGSETSLFYFEDNRFWIEQREQIGRHAIQLDFEVKYQVIEQLGMGSFSKVFKVRCNSNGSQYAAKVIEKNDKHKVCTKRLVIEQKKILNLMSQSQGTSRFIQCFEMEDQYIFILQYLPGKDLMTLLRKKQQMEPYFKKHLLGDLLVVLKQCHAKHIIHRDIKPQNIIFNQDTNRSKIIDFGLSIIVGQNTQGSHFKRCGTMGYMAPEVIAANQNQFKKPYTSKCDMFSFGIIAHMVLMGTNPLKGKTYEQTCALNKECSIELNKDKITSAFGQNGLIFLQRLLAINPKVRYSAQQALNSKFLRESDKQKSISTVEDRQLYSWEE